MKDFRFSTYVMAVAVAVILLPSGHALAIGGPAFVYSPLIPVVGETVEFAYNAGGNPIFWAWEFDDGATGSGPTPTHIFNRAGEYNVKMTAWDQRGHKDDWALPIVVIEDPQLSAPTAGFSFSPSSPAVNQPVNFEDTSVGNPLSWEWDFGDDETSTEQWPSHAFAEAGSYIVELTVTNLAGSDEESHTVTVFGEVQQPEASFFFLPANPAVGQFVNFFDTSGGGTADSWEWDFDDGGGSSEQYPSHQFASEGTYDVSLTVTNSAGETSTQQTVNVGAEIPPIDPDFDEVYFVPSASHAAGAEGSFWATDMDVNNAGDDTAAYKLGWLPRNADNAAPPFSDVFTLEPGEAVRLEDVVLSVFDIVDGFGALAVVSDSRDLFIFSRTYNDTDLGTFGQAISGVPFSDLIGSGEIGRIIFLSENPDFRTNLGCVNGKNADLNISIDLFDDEGMLLETKTMNLAPFSNKQINKIFGANAPTNGYADVRSNTDGAAYYCYGSFLDNGSSDPTTIVPVMQ